MPAIKPTYSLLESNKTSGVAYAAMSGFERSIYSHVEVYVNPLGSVVLTITPFIAGLLVHGISTGAIQTSNRGSFNTVNLSTSVLLGLLLSNSPPSLSFRVPPFHELSLVAPI